MTAVFDITDSVTLRMLGRLGSRGVFELLWGETLVQTVPVEAVLKPLGDGQVEVSWRLRIDKAEVAQ